jgi:urea transport system permease protein
MTRIFALLLTLVVAAIIPMTPLKADDIKELTTKLGTASFDEKAEVVDALAARGDAKAITVLQALSAGKLFVRTGDNLVLIGKGEDGAETFTDIETGEAVAADVNAVEKVRVNNMLRRKVSAAVDRLGILSEDAGIRLTSARAAFLEHQEASLPIIEQAIAKETVPKVKKALEQAKGSIVLHMSGVDDEALLAAINVVKERGDEDARNFIKGFTTSESQKVREAAVSAEASINTTLLYWGAAQNAWYGLSLGSVLLLAAIGLAITMGVMGVINMAHGEMVMLGAYTTYVVQNAVQEFAPGLSSFSLVIAVPMAFLVSGAVGVAIERSIIRFLYGRPLETLLATWGLSLVLQQTIRSIFGPTNKTVSSPPWMSGAFEIGHLTVTYNRLWIIIFSLAVLALLMALLKYTRFGLQTRAVTQNRPMASAMGIRTVWIDALTFGLGSGIAGIAGVALSQLDNVSPNLGQSYIIDSFMVVVFGGVGNLWGTLVGAMTLGVANKFLEPYAGAVLGKIFVLIFIILFIQRRPRGLFALKGRALEG